MTTDPTLLEELLTLTVAAGVEPVVAQDAAEARPWWREAPLVVIGEDAAQAVVDQLGRRSHIVLIGADASTVGVWSRGVSVGAEHVVFLPEAQAWLVRQLADAAEVHGRGGLMVATIGSRGGAGATTLAVALALSASGCGRKTVIVDLDPLGGGVDLLFGGDQQASGLRWPDLTATRGRLIGHTLWSQLPRLNDVAVLTWSRCDPAEDPNPTAVQSVLDAAARAADVVVVDLPRQISPAGEAALRVCAPILLVVPAEIRAVAAAARVAARLERAPAPVRLVVRGPSPGGLSASLISESLGLPLVGFLAPEPNIARDVERGRAPCRARRGPLADFCRSLMLEFDVSRAA